MNVVAAVFDVVFDVVGDVVGDVLGDVVVVAVVVDVVVHVVVVVADVGDVGDVVVKAVVSVVVAMVMNSPPISPIEHRLHVLPRVHNHLTKYFRNKSFIELFSPFSYVFGFLYILISNGFFNLFLKN